MPHFAHIHAHGVGGAPEFGIGLRERGFGFGNGIFVGDGGAVVVHQQAVGIGGFFGYLDAQALNHVDDVVNLLGIGHVVGQGVVDFGVGDVAALFALDDEAAQAFALLFGGERAVVVAEGFFVFLFGEVFFRHRGHSIGMIYPRIG